mmetsp:Transcript_15301/g.44433  ORF Transcript_15301/g.44433 Transcript_15301/m.44433 type:complete len:300 (+) Transcript_15301:679-1578(+)
MDPEAMVSAAVAVAELTYPHRGDSNFSAGRERLFELKSPPMIWRCDDACSSGPPPEPERRRLSSKSPSGMGTTPSSSAASAAAAVATTLSSARAASCTSIACFRTLATGSAPPGKDRWALAIVTRLRPPDPLSWHWAICAIRCGPVRTGLDSSSSSFPRLLISTAMPSSRLGRRSAALSKMCAVCRSNSSSNSGLNHHSCSSTTSDAASSSATYRANPSARGPHHSRRSDSRARGGTASVSTAASKAATDDCGMERCTAARTLKVVTWRASADSGGKAAAARRRERSHRRSAGPDGRRC